MTVPEKVGERGFWKFLIRPLPYRKSRVESLADLAAVVERSSVRLRGWDFPHISRNSPIERHADHVSQSTDWEHYVEAWRLYKSGQFVYWRAVSEDWRDQSSLWRAPPDWGKHLGVGDVMFQLVEYFTFAGRLAVSPAGDERLQLQATLFNADGRSLWLEDSRKTPFSYDRIASASQIDAVDSVLTREEVVGDLERLSKQAAKRVFELFSWDVGPKILDSQFSETQGRR